MSRLHLDFAAPRRRPVLAWLALAAGAVLLLPVADRYVDLDNDLSEQTRQLTRLKRNLKGSERRPSNSGNNAGKAQSSRDLAWLEQVRNPQWRDQLQALEQATDAGIALLQVDADFAAGRIQLGAEAKTMDNALAYADRLHDSGHFTSANVDGHDLRQREGQDVVGFTLTLGRTNSQPPAVKTGAVEP